MVIKVSSLLAHNTNLSDDTVPVLGGNLNTNGFEITNGVNPVIISGNSYPASTGSSGQVLSTNGSGILSFITLSSGGPITLTGDVTGTGTSSITTTLSSTGVAIGTYGTSSSVGVFTVDAKGRLSSASNTLISISPTQAGLGSVVNALQVVNTGGVPGIQAGSGVPSGSATSGQLYVDVIGNNMYRYTGSVWSPLTGNTILFAENVSSPTIPVSSGTNAIAVGSGSNSSGSNSFSVGPGANATMYGQRAYANGVFSSSGDAQFGIYILRCITIDATPTEMFLDGAAATQRIILPPFSVFSFTITVVARRTDATDGASSYEFKGIAKRDSTASTISFIGVPSKTIIGEINTNWDAILTVDTTNGSLKISSTGQAGKTIRWVAVVNTTEVTN